MIPRLLIFLLTCLPLQAQRKPDGPAKDNRAAGGAPAVNAQEVKVVRGQSVSITLTGTTGSNRQMTFLLRELPKLGTFKEQKPETKDKLSATLTYMASATGNGNKDTFTFAAQVPGSSVCEPATVTILITDPSVKLDTLDTVEIKTVVLRHPAEKQWLVRNGGNAPWERKVPAPKGWKWLAPPDGAFKLAGGAEIQARIQCEGTAIGPLEETVDFGMNTKITFRARVVRPFAVKGENVELKWQPDTVNRMGSVEVVNNDTMRELTVAIAAPDWLTVEKELKIPPDQTLRLLLALNDRYVERLSGTMKLSGGEYGQEVKLTTVAAPAFLDISEGYDDRGGLHFGKLTADTLPLAKKPFKIRNEGGTSTTVTLKMPEHFRLDKPLPDAGVVVGPGEDFSLVLLPPNETVGSFQDNLTFSGGDIPLKVPCSAGVDPSAIPISPGRLAQKRLEEMRKRETDRAMKQAQKDKAKAINVLGPVVSDGTEDPKIPRVHEVSIAADDGETVTFAWDLPDGDGWTFRLFRATVERLAGTGGLGKVFEPCGDEVKYTVEGRQATATVSGLWPHVPFVFRIQTIAADGRKGIPGKQIKFEPYPPDPSFWSQYKEFVAGGAGLLVALGIWMWRKWKEPISARA